MTASLISEKEDPGASVPLAGSRAPGRVLVPRAALVSHSPVNIADVLTISGKPGIPASAPAWRDHCLSPAVGGLAIALCQLARFLHSWFLVSKSRKVVLVLLFSLLLFYCMCMDYILFAYMSMYHMHIWCPQRPQEDVGSLGIGISEWL